MKTHVFNWLALLKSPEFLPTNLRLLLVVSFPLLAYYQDFGQVFNLALSVSEAQYVLLVPFVAAYFFYRRRKAFLVAKENSKLHDFAGISICLFALLVYVLGSYSFYSLQLHLISLPIFVTGLILLFFGANVVKLLVFPIAMMIFLSPFPLFFMDSFGGYLLISDGALAAAFLGIFLPIDIVYTPTVIITTISTAGESIKFSIEPACSGIYSLTAFLFCAVVFGYLASGSIFKKVLYGVLAVATAYFLNVFRITATIIIGHFFGHGAATDFFHTVGGTVLAFIGTLILLFFGTKFLKLSFMQTKSALCICDNLQSACGKCGRILKWPQPKIKWKHTAIILVFLVFCSALIVQASAVNYNIVLKTEEAAFDFDPQTGDFEAFSNQTGYHAIFMTRETQAEQQLGLMFVGDYYLSKMNTATPDNVYAIFEMADLKSKFHTWEGCLHYQSYPISIQSISYPIIYDENNNIVNGEVIVANAPTLNQTINLIYWFDALTLRINGTITTLHVKFNLIKYLPNLNNQTDPAKVVVATDQLTSLARSYESIWSQYKQTNNSFVVDLYRNSTAFEAVVVALLAISTALLARKQLLLRFSARKKTASLTEEDKALLKQLKGSQRHPDKQPPLENTPELTAKIEEWRKQGLLREKVTMDNDELHLRLLPY